MKLLNLNFGLLGVKSGNEEVWFFRGLGQMKDLMKGSWD